MILTIILFNSFNRDYSKYLKGDLPSNQLEREYREKVCSHRHDSTGNIYAYILFPKVSKNILNILILH